MRLESTSEAFSEHSKEDLEEKFRYYSQLKETLQELLSHKLEIEHRLNEALNGSSVQQANAQHQIAIEGMVQSRNDTIRKMLRNELVGWLKKQRDTQDTPELLIKVKDNFNKFTDHQYKLTVIDGSFVIRDLKSGVQHELDTLSDGTRIQLLFAAKFAYIQHIEKEERLPIFLDEVFRFALPIFLQH